MRQLSWIEEGPVVVIARTPKGSPTEWEVTGALRSDVAI